jgi:phytoene synthase
MVTNPVPTEAYAHCQHITKAEAKNFYYAFVTLPKARRRAIYATYAFCRLCDDIADEPLPVEEKLRQLHEVEEALEQAKNGHADGPVYQALAHAVQEYGIPWEDLIEVIRGVEMDLTITRYETFEDLRVYCYRVASVIGLICIQVCGYSDPKAREYAIELGLAMQLTNILRDIREDSEMGRVYLPQEDLAGFSYSEEQLMAGELNAEFTQFMEFQVARARDYFKKGKRLLKLLPMRTRACPSVLGGIYSRVLDRIEDKKYDVYERRISLPRREKLFLTVRIWALSYVPLERVATAW